MFSRKIVLSKIIRFIYGTELYREWFKNREVPRRRPEFESGVAGAEADKLKKFIDAGGLKCSGCPTPAEPILEPRAV